MAVGNIENIGNTSKQKPGSSVLLLTKPLVIISSGISETSQKAGEEQRSAGICKEQTEDLNISRQERS